MGSQWAKRRPACWVTGTFLKFLTLWTSCWMTRLIKAFKALVSGWIALMLSSCRNSQGLLHLNRAKSYATIWKQSGKRLACQQNAYVAYTALKTLQHWLSEPESLDSGLQGSELQCKHLGLGWGTGFCPSLNICSAMLSLNPLIQASPRSFIAV